MMPWSSRSLAGLLLLASACAPGGHEDSASSASVEVAANNLSLTLARMRDVGQRTALQHLANATQELDVLLDAHGQVLKVSAPELGERRWEDASSEADARAAVLAFLHEHGSLYGLASDELVELQVTRVNLAGRERRVILQQRYGGSEVEDGQLTAFFDARGQLRSLRGRVHSARVLATLRDSGEESAARKAASDFMQQGPYKGREIKALELEAERVLSVRHGTALFRMHAAAADQFAVSSELRIDGRGQVLASDDDVAPDAVEVPIQHFQHPDGAAHGGQLSTSNMNVDREVVPGNLRCKYSLQRLGSGRARMWSAKAVPANTATPAFDKQEHTTLCTVDPSTLSYFTLSPGASDTNWHFNEQQAYFWAQWLKTEVDDWGREPNSFGSYPSNADRQTNVEVVVNADSGNEQTWCSAGVMHGCFVGSVDAKWFPGIDTTRTTVPTVFLFDSAGNSSSPQFEGSEFSPTYPAVVHEVGHFVSWTYGSWNGVGTMKSSLNEGYSMVLPALFGLTKWSALGYADSQEVTTGSKQAGKQWTHHTSATDLQDYRKLSCNPAANESNHQYFLAWPFVQAIWHIANNRDEAGNAIWTSSDAAVRNTADMVMRGLAADAGTAGMNWTLLVDDLLSHLKAQIKAGVVQGMPADHDPFVQVRAVFRAHGLYESSAGKGDAHCICDATKETCP